MTEVHLDYGAEALFSEHRRGDMISYWCQQEWDTEPKVYSGEILWVCAPSTLPTGKQVGVRSIVAPTIETGFIDVVFPGDVIHGQ